MTARIQVIGVCPRFRCAFKFDENRALSSNMWHVFRACTWDVSTVEMLGSVRPFAPYMAMISKLVDGDSCNALLNQGALFRLRMRARQGSCASIRYLIKKFFTATANRVAKDTLTRMRFAPPISLTAGLLKRYYELLGVDIRNAALPNPSEIVERPANDAVMCATWWSPAGRMECSDG